MKFIYYIVVWQILIVGQLGAGVVEAALVLEDCQKCHDPQWVQIASNGGAHKEKVSCLDCHESHRPQQADNIPACTDCHGTTPHKEIADCASCHPRNEKCVACHMAHQPFVWSPGVTAPQHCQVCHPQAVELLKASTSKHHSLECTFCHTMHREIHQCQDCHGTPHPAGTHQMFPQCGICHNIAHDLSPK